MPSSTPCATIAILYLRSELSIRAVTEELGKPRRTSLIGYLCGAKFEQLKARDGRRSY
jgi:hypothetical protein